MVISKNGSSKLMVASLLQWPAFVGKQIFIYLRSGGRAFGLSNY